MFLKVPTLEDLKLPIDFPKSALSMPEKLKVDVLVTVPVIFFMLGWISYFFTVLLIGST